MSDEIADEQTYTVQGVHCLNCGWNKIPHFDRGQEAKIPKGTSVSEYRCPNCGCAKMWKDGR